jgi:hypothetical protein
MYSAFIVSDNEKIVIKEAKTFDACKRHLSAIVSNGHVNPRASYPGTIIHISDNDNNIIKSFVVRSGKSKKVQLRVVDLNSFKVIKRTIGDGGYFKSKNEIPGFEFVDNIDIATKFYDNTPLIYALQHIGAHFTYMRGIEVEKIN